MKTYFNARVKIVGCVDTLPYGQGTGGRTDLLFLIHDDDVPSFAFTRFDFFESHPDADLIRWWEDVVHNAADQGRQLYPGSLLSEYPCLW